MNSIFKKVAFRIMVLFVSVMTLASAGMVFHFDGLNMQDTQDDLVREAQMIDRIVQYSENFTDVTNYIDSNEDIRFTIFDLSGTAVLNTEQSLTGQSEALFVPEVADALDSGMGVDIRYIETIQETRMFVAISSSKDYIVRTSTPMRGMDVFAMTVLLPLFVIFIISLLLCLVLALFISRGLTRPITELKNNAIHISTGEDNAVDTLETGDEIQSLSYAINNMVSVLKSNIKDLAEKNSQLNAVFQAIPSGILAFNTDEYVITANHAALEMFAFRDRGADVKTLEMNKYVELKSVVRRAMTASGVVQEELLIGENGVDTILKVFAVPAHSEGVLYGVILLAQDITQMRKLENMQSDFVTNVSHELRTPLTVIRGFVETLKEKKVPKQDAQRFLDIISLESERLTKLIDHILALSELEQVEPFTGSGIDIRAPIMHAVRMLKSTAKKRSIRLHILLPNEKIFVAAKQDHIKHLMINLIDNAIKYSNENGQIVVTLKKRGESALITVEDNGIGIPPEDIPKLFERFYRVDKSRSRALGGTGLGLAIVKKIVNLLNGKVEVSSEQSKGTTFSISLPLAPIGESTSGIDKNP